MKQFTAIQLSAIETIGAIALLAWIIAACFVPLPDVNSLGY